MLSRSPIAPVRYEELSEEELVEAIRYAIIAELDAINLYTQIARLVNDDKIRRVFEDIAREEKTHVGEFLALLKMIDKEQAEELLAGEKEVEELTGFKT